MAIAEQTASRREREVNALAGIAWAYLSALQRSDFVVATSLLSVFQQSFNTYRSGVVASATSPAAYDAALPRSLAVNGRFDAATRDAMRGTLNLLAPFTGHTGSMPTQAGQLGDWWYRTLAVRGQSAEQLNEFDWIARDSEPHEAAFAVSSAAEMYILGSIPPTPPAIAAGNAQTSRVTNTARQTQQQPSFTPSRPTLTTGPSSSSSTLVTTRVTTLPGQVVTGTPPFWKEPWFFWSLLAGGALLGGSLAYQTYRRGGLKKVWRQRR